MDNSSKTDSSSAGKQEKGLWWMLTTDRLSHNYNKMNVIGSECAAFLQNGAKSQVIIMQRDWWKCGRSKDPQNTLLMPSKHPPKLHRTWFILVSAGGVLATPILWSIDWSLCSIPHELSDACFWKETHNCLKNNQAEEHSFTLDCIISS